MDQDSNKGAAASSSKTPNAGWGVAIYKDRQIEEHPPIVLYGPVTVDKKDHRWLGAEVATNSTGELMALMEAMLWLRDEAPDDGHTPALLVYDSEYAADAIRGVTEPPKKHGHDSKRAKNPGRD